MTYSYAQLEAIAKLGGFPDNMLPVMAAIALAESGGNPNAVNLTDNGGRQSSFGLWQISTGTHNPPDPHWADPVVNARLAFGKYQSQGLGAWGTYTSNRYKSYMQGPLPPDFNIGPPAAAPTANILDPSTWFNAFLSPLADITNYIIWIGIAAGGLILFTAGAFLLFKDGASTSGTDGVIRRYVGMVKHVATVPVRYAR